MTLKNHFIYVTPSRYLQMMSYSVQVAITKFHRLGGLNNKLFLLILEPGKVKIKVSTDLVSDESPFPDL